MKSRFIKNKYLSLVAIFILLTISLCFITFRILVKDFNKLELQQNTENINTFIKEINILIDNANRSVSEYSKWDDTYDFIRGKNKTYIYDNFRSGTNTLEKLNMDFILYVNKNNEVLFSKYLKKVDKNFEKKLLKKVDIEQFSSLIKYDDKFIYLIKDKIKKSDYTGKKVGFLITGKYINKDVFSNLSKVFSSLEFSNKKLVKTHITKKLEDGTIVKTELLLEDKLTNYIHFFNIKDEKLLTLVTTNHRDILEKGKGTIYILNFVIFFSFLIILILFIKNQRIMESYSLKLENEVYEKTKELKETLDELREKNEKLDKISRLDPLTNIRNRRSFFKDAKNVLNYAIKNKKEFSILIIDIDFFKKINDTYGHATGDKVLVEFCKEISRIIPDNSIFGRLGGEEFSIVFKNIDFQSTEKIAEEIRKKIEEMVLDIDGQKIKFTISIGLIQRKNEKYLDEMLALADEYLYTAKKIGRNKVVRDTIR